MRIEGELIESARWWLTRAQDAASDGEEIGEVATEATLVDAVDALGEAVGAREGDEGVLE